MSPQELLLRNTMCHFTAHRGETWYIVVQTDQDYVEWCMDNLDLEKDLCAALQWGIKHVPRRIG